MDSKLIIARDIKLDKNYTNVLSYDTNDMLSLVESKAEYTENNYNYIDYTKNEIMANVDYTVAMSCNYIAFQNPRHGNKWYFAFIDDVKYKAPNQCLIIFTIDVWSTFFDDWSAKPCFVVREHVNSDNVGEHTVPESVTLGDYVCTAHLRDSYNRDIDNYRVIISTNITPSEAQKVNWGGNFNGIPSAFAYWAYLKTDGSGIGGAINTAQTNNGNINQCFFAPKWLLEYGGVSTGRVSNSEEPKTQMLTISKITALDGYTPTNKKLLTYPYCFIKSSNGQGQEGIYHQELWSPGITGDVELIMKGCLTPGCSIRLYPLDYAGDEISTENGINLGKFPQLNWATDPYVNWLTQQGVSQGMSAITNVVSSPEPVGTGIKEIGSLMYNEYKAERTPPQVFGNQNAGDVTCAMSENCFHLYKMTIKQEYARQIDKYFSRYGYKVNDVKTPNITGRANFNFIEIGKDDCIGYGSLPSKYMEEINNICRQGVTIWHNHNNLGNYNINNPII